MAHRQSSKAQSPSAAHKQLRQLRPDPACPCSFRGSLSLAQADIDVTVKGARPQPKIYTDLHGIVEGVSGCYGPGLEPSIWQVSTAHICTGMLLYWRQIMPEPCMCPAQNLGPRSMWLDVRCSTRSGRQPHHALAFLLWLCIQLKCHAQPLLPALILYENGWQRQRWDSDTQGCHCITCLVTSSAGMCLDSAVDPAPICGINSCW